MKNRSTLQSLLICLFAGLTFASSSARADTTTWTGAIDNDWFKSGNWDHGVPILSTDVYINNGGKAEINISGAKARSVTLGFNQGNSGTLSVNGTNGGALDLASGECATSFPKDGAIYIGYRGKGTLNITNGGHVSSQSAYMAVVVNPTKPLSNGTAKVDGTDSTWAVSGQCSGQLIVSGSSMSDVGSSALLSVTNGGKVVIEENKISEGLWVNSSGTLAGNGTISTTSSSLPTTFVKGTFAPSGTFHIDTNFRLDFLDGVMVSHGAAGQSVDRVDVSGYARPGGRLVVIMTGDFSTTPRRYNLLHTDVNLSGIEFHDPSFLYPPGQGFVPSLSYDDNNVYLDLNFD